jgi:cellulose synthase/poly-beta-1,6-N-acetylglucosamine synthase-like glycosyltransferase
MSIFLVVFACASAVILIIHIALCAGILRLMRAESRRTWRNSPAKGEPDTRPPVVEIVVAARDEAASLPALLESLRAQTDGDCLFLFVDDRSTDDTARLLDEFCESMGSRARVIHNRAEPEGLTGKQAALDLAFAAAKGEILVFTDGDCIAPPGWAEEIASHFDEPEVGVVLGRLEMPEGRNFLARFQAFEQPLINQYNFGAAGLGMPMGCFGNNMSVRTDAVKATGGFRRLGYAVTEDALLLEALCRQGGWRVRVCTSARGVIVTAAKTSWKAYSTQHVRWNSGALFATDFISRSFYWCVVLFYLVGSLVVMPLGIIDWRVSLVSLNSFLSIGLLAILGGAYGGKKRGRYYLRLLPHLLFFGFFYSWITVRALFKRPFDWKGAAVRP